MKIFTAKTGNPKTSKNEAHSIILHVAPASLSGWNVCKFSTAGCRASCLNRAGRGGIGKPELNTIQLARIERARLFFQDRAEFWSRAYWDLLKLGRQAQALGLGAAARLNGTSDLPFERIKPELFTDFPSVQFYDYTKHPNRTDLPENYHLTFSLSETNKAQALEVLDRGQNVAAVFATKKGQALPETCWGYPVFDADLTDERYLDPYGIAGLRAKGPAIKDTSGFVLNEDGTQRLSLSAQAAYDSLWQIDRTTQRRSLSA
mgnify:CR=1 FL=1